MKRLVFMGIAFAGLVLFAVGTPAQARAQGADDPAQVEAGQAVYEMSCAGCHGVDGSGVAGRGRPLIGIAAQGDRATHVASITDGKGGMPAFGERLSSDEIEQAASYVRLSFVEAAAGSEDTSESELAMTGATSTGLAVVGLTMLLGGMHLVVWSRRRHER